MRYKVPSSFAWIQNDSRPISPVNIASDQKQQTDELVRLKEELEDLACAVAHDLAEPLRTVSMFTHLLVKKVELDPEGKLLSQFIIDAVTRMSALLQGLHAFLIRESDDIPQRLDLGRVFAGALQNLGHAISTSGGNVTVDPLPWVEGNEKQLLRVFQNLLSNAIKYRSAAPVEIHVSAAREGSNWLIRIKDNGMGIAPDHHERVFGLLKRLHGPEIPGAGIGLTICKKIVEEAGGTIWVESEPGDGSTFCFTIASATEGRAISAFPDNGRLLNRALPDGSDRSIDARSRAQRRAIARGCAELSLNRERGAILE